MFRIDLQVQIHVSDTRAPKVISLVATMLNATLMPVLARTARPPAVPPNAQRGRA